MLFLSNLVIFWDLKHTFLYHTLGEREVWMMWNMTWVYGLGLPIRPLWELTAMRYSDTIEHDTRTQRRYKKRGQLVQIAHPHHWRHNFWIINPTFHCQTKHCVTMSCVLCVYLLYPPTSQKGSSNQDDAGCDSSGLAIWQTQLDYRPLSWSRTAELSPP